MNHSYKILGALVCTAIVTPTFAAALSPCPYEWQRDLRIGMSGEDVLQLQRYLNGYADTAISPSGVGSAGFETRAYGPRTAAAITRFQEKYASEILHPINLSRGTGSLGLRSRTKLNELCAGARTVMDDAAPQSASVSALTIARPEQPAQTIAPSGAGGVPFTSFTLAASGADVEIRSITIMLTGAAAKGAFESVIVEEADGAFATEEKGFTSQNTVTLSAGFTIAAGSTHTFTVFGNMDETADYAGQMPVLRVSAIDASAPISGGIPLDGTAQRINGTLEIGGATASRSSYDPAEDGTVYINETGVRFAGIQLMANSREELLLDAISWEQAGSAGANDIAQITTVIDGIVYPTIRDGRVYTTNIEPAIRIPRGRLIDVFVQGDILPSAANRTVKFDLYESGALSLTGAEYGYGVGITPSAHTAASGNSVFLTSDGSSDGEEITPFFSGSLFTVSGGALNSVTRN